MDKNIMMSWSNSMNLAAFIGYWVLKTHACGRGGRAGILVVSSLVTSPCPEVLWTESQRGRSIRCEMTGVAPCVTPRHSCYEGTEGSLLCFSTTVPGDLWCAPEKGQVCPLKLLESQYCIYHFKNDLN